MSDGFNMDDSSAQNTFTRIHEVLLKEGEKWLYFANPHRVIIAQKLEEIIPALREIERLIKVNTWHAAGFVSYEAASAFDSALRTLPEAGFPFLWFGLYSQPNPVSRIGNPNYNTLPTLNWQLTVDRETYNTAIEQIRNHIADGRTYQVNYTMRLQADFTGSAWDFFLHLAQSQNNHAAYIDMGRYVICSASPELFFQLDGDTITCRPMKGTVKRGRTTFEDEAQSQWLKNSEKNRAENVMIVDMIRNDLGRIAKIGSVSVPELFNTERYPTLWQMTSTVKAKTNASMTEIFKALFPSASITGAPKVGTMRIIAGLETTPRRVYTGSVGYIAPNRKATFNVAIRTALIDRETQKAEYGVGGGIVWDSTSADEYAEALLKARVLTEQKSEFSLLETILWTPQEGFFLQEKHIARILDSANYFDFPASKEKIEEYLKQISLYFDSPQRVRLLLDRYGTLHSEASSFQPKENSRPLKVCLAREPIDSNNVFLFHKTTYRKVYNDALKALGSQTPKEHKSYDDVLLYNERGELTEFTIGNLVLELDGKLFTPPISCGLLPGTFRALLMETGQIVERTVRVEELKDCTKMFMINSVHRWQEVELVN
ncbi:MAG: aminodeoxychorismate synthase component I [Anaerolineae bacterium]|nr:aminodeoxychorismate synthase component I [Anaerolineae bacterium]